MILNREINHIKFEPKMTKTICAFLLGILFNFNVIGQDLLNNTFVEKVDVELPDLNFQTILSRLFEIKSFSSNKEGLWSPNIYEKINMPVSDDGYCHTSVDTILFNNKEKAVVIFKSIEYNNGNPFNCHACAVLLSIATFNKIENGWRLVQFKKRFKYAGRYGGYLGFFEIKRFGKNLICLSHHDEIDGGQGYNEGWEYYYSLEENDDYEKVFQYKYYDTNEDAVEKNGFTDNTTLKIIKTTDFYNILLTTKRNGKEAIKKKVFEYSNEYNYYIPKSIK